MVISSKKKKRKKEKPTDCKIHKKAKQYILRKHTLYSKTHGTTFGLPNRLYLCNIFN